MFRATVIATLRSFRALVTTHPSGKVTFHISTGQCLAMFGEDCASHRRKKTDVTPYLDCTFADMSPIEYVRKMDGWKLVRHYLSATTTLSKAA